MNSRDMKHMKTAIRESRRSLPEDKRSHPKVGVVVIGKDGKKIGKAHRGQRLKDAESGAHAEHVALEKLSSRTLSGATVYTTLEPCTTRNHPNVPCVKRLIERRVKRVVIGMLDPNPQILGLGWLELRKKNIETDFFPSRLMRKIEELNREFIDAQSAYHRRAKLLRGREVYDQALQLLKKSTESIVVLTYSETPPAPVKFAYAIRDQLKQHEHLYFEVVIAVNLKKMPKAFWVESDRRFAIYAAGALSHRVHRWVLDTNIPSGFDVMIIDQKHVLVAFSPLPVANQDKKQLALFMQDDLQLARGLSSWLVGLKRSARRYEDCYPMSRK